MSDININNNQSPNTDIILIILDYLYNKKLLNTFITLEKETNISLFSYNKELSFLRTLILEGKWDKAEDFIIPLKEKKNFDYKEAIFLIKREKFFEDTESEDGDQTNLEKQLNEIKNYCSKDKFNEILSLLNLNSIKDNSNYKNWTPVLGRQICFEKIRILMNPFYPINNETERKLIIKNNENLLEKIIKLIVGEEKFNFGEIIKECKNFLKNDKLHINNNNCNNNNYYNNKNNNHNNRIYSANVNNKNKNTNITNNNISNISNINNTVSTNNNNSQNKSKINQNKNNTNKNINSNNHNINNNHNNINADNNINNNNNNILEPSNQLPPNRQKTPYDEYSYDPSSYYLETLIVDSQAIRTGCFNPVLSNSINSTNKINYMAIGTNSKSLKIYNISQIISKFKTPNITNIPNNNINNNNNNLTLPLIFEKLNYHQGSIYCIDWSPNNKLIATGSNDKQIKILLLPDELILNNNNNINTNDLLQLEINGHKGTIRTLLFPHNDSSTLLSAGVCDNNIFMWDTQSGKQKSSLIGHYSEIHSIKNNVNNSNNNLLICSCEKNNVVNFYDMKTNNPSITLDISSLLQINNKNYGYINDISFNNELLSVAHTNGMITIWDYLNKKIVKEIACSDNSEEIRTCNFSIDCKFLQAGGFDKKIKIYDVYNDFNIVKTLEHDDKVVFCKWHPSLPFFVSTSTDKTARIWMPKNF